MERILRDSGRAEGKARAYPFMPTVNAERVEVAVGGKKLSTTLTVTGRNGIVQRYFYFAMSLLLAAIVVSGFKRTTGYYPLWLRKSAAIHAAPAMAKFSALPAQLIS
jgi:hypothetical protein